MTSNPSAPLLRLENVGLKTALGGRPLLHDISFSVQPGDRLTLIGPSGAGKTSLLRLLNRLSEASEGDIFWEQQNIRQLPVLYLRQQIVLVLQEAKLLGMTVRQAVSYPLKLRNIPAKTVEQRLLTVMEQLRIPLDWLDRTEPQLSVGQRQRVAIARALVCQPKLLLLDEPTSAQDAGNATHLLETITALTQSGQTTVVMVNHQLELSRQFSDRVLYLKQGSLVHNLFATDANWDDLKQDLLETEKQQAEVWD